MNESPPKKINQNEIINNKEKELNRRIIWYEKNTK